MAFDFPNSPSEGQIFNAPSGPTYVFNSPRWKAMAQGQIAIISDTAPTAPANGTLWFESDTGILFISMNDGNSTQWVQCGGIAAGGAINQWYTINSGSYVKPEGLRYLQVTVVGGGGGGGYGRSSASSAACGAGGGGGSAVTRTYAASELAASTAYTLGAGGAGGVGATPTVAGNGGTSTFADLSAGGGAAGSSSGIITASITVSGGAHSTATGDGGSVLQLGDTGSPGIIISGSAGSGVGGYGGAGAFCGGVGRGSATNGNGAGGGPGGGGGGALAVGASSTNGGNGGGGRIVFTEYF